MKHNSLKKEDWEELLKYIEDYEEFLKMNPRFEPFHIFFSPITTLTRLLYRRWLIDNGLTYSRSKKIS